MKRSTHPVIGVGTLNLDARARELVNEVLLNNRLSYGPMSRKFEADFAKAHDCRFAVLSNSGTSALQIALQALKELHGWEDGDEVLVPAVTFVATANIVLHNNLTPVFVDVESDMYGMDVSLIEKAITPKTRAIVPVHLFGMPCDMEGIQEIAKAHNLKIVEDSAETMFASHKGQMVGSLSDIGCFSTYVAHILVTGVGGLSTTNNPDYAVCMRSLLNHGRDSIYLSIDDDSGLESEELKMVVARRFRFARRGHSFRVTEMEAALGVAAMETADSMISRRRSNANYLTRELSRYEDRLQLPKIRPGCEHSFMMYPIVVRDEAKHDLVNFLEQRGVETRDMLPLVNQPVYSELVKEDDFPVAKWINNNGFYVGCHQDLGMVDLSYMVGLFERYFRSSHSAPVREGAVLVLILEGSDTDLEDMVENLPRELFTKIVAVDQSGHFAESQVLKSNGIEVLGQAASPLEAIANSENDLPYENIVFFPATGQFDQFDISRVLLTLERGYDMVIASRFIMGGRREGKKPGRYRSVGNRVFNFLASLIFEGNITDGLSPFRGIKRSRLRELSLKRNDLSGLYQLSIQALKRNWQIAEIPTRELVDMGWAQYVRAFASVPGVFGVLLTEAGRGAD